jgi:hypothetical protein
MLYRGWSIQAHPYFAGYAAQYTSPTGRAYHTAACFASDGQAVAYAQALVDYLLRCEGLLLDKRPQDTLAA